MQTNLSLIFPLCFCSLCIVGALFRMNAKKNGCTGQPLFGGSGYDAFASFTFSGEDAAE